MMRTAIKDPSESEALNMAILKCICSGFTRGSLIAEELKIHSSTIYMRLYKLAEEGRAYFTREKFANRNIMVWHVGQNPVQPEEKITFPIIGGRDFFVAALFGERRSEPRCVCCGSSQSAGHVGGCMFLGAA